MKKLVLILLITYGCSGHDKYSTMSVCEQDLKQFLIKNWIFNKDSAWYEGSHEFYVEMKSHYRPCLMSLNSDQVRILFGMPTKSSTGTFMYRLVGCKLVDCPYYQFTFDSSMKVKSFSMMRQVQSYD